WHDEPSDGPEAPQELLTVVQTRIIIILAGRAPTPGRAGPHWSLRRSIAIVVAPPTLEQPPHLSRRRLRLPRRSLQPKRGAHQLASPHCSSARVERTRAYRGPLRPRIP